MNAPKASCIVAKTGKYLRSDAALLNAASLKRLSFSPDRGFRGRNRVAAQALTGHYQRQSRLRGLPMIVSVLITFLVVILILYLINLLPLDGRAKQIARVVVIILGVISLLKYIAVF
jgi:hypothetical protein